MPDKVSRW